MTRSRHDLDGADVVFAHGGTIDVVSAPEAGATFTMRLPRHHDARAA